MTNEVDTTTTDQAASDELMGIGVDGYPIRHPFYGGQGGLYKE